MNLNRIRRICCLPLRNMPYGGRVLAVSAVLAFSVAALPVLAQSADNLLVNASMEEGAGGAPTGWKRGGAVKGVEQIWDRAVAHSGNASLCLRKTEQRYFPIAQWFQTIGTTVPLSASYIEVGAWVKADKVMKAILDVQFRDDKDKGSHHWIEYIGHQSNTDVPLDHDWKLYKSAVILPPGVQRVSVGLQIYGPGTVWFDDVTARYLSADEAEAVIGTAPSDELTSALAEMQACVQKGELDRDFTNLAMKVSRMEDPRAIPVMIGIIDADNSKETVRKLGTCLKELTKVEPDSVHDGAWWRRWWEKNKSKYPEAVRNMPIPDYPKTVKGKTYKPFPEDTETTAGKLAILEARIRTGKLGGLGLGGVAEELAEQAGPECIPALIGIIDADNSYDTVYGVGYFALGKLTSVKYSELHDGAWWRRWWEKNKGQYPEAVRNLPIPEYPKTASGRQYTPLPEDSDTTAGKLKLLEARIRAGKLGGSGLGGVAEQLAEQAGPECIPALIGIIDADNTNDTVYGVGYFALGKVTGVQYSESHNGKWWCTWWEENRAKYPPHVRAMGIPDYRDAVAEGRKTQKAREKAGALADVADVPCQDLKVPSNERMRYFLIGPRKDDKPSSAGYKLLVVLPGGDGGENVNPFVRRIYKNALGDGYLIAQPVAFKWTVSQRIVWPTLVSKAWGQGFSTEEFVEAVIADVKKRQPVDARHVYLLAWSSGGPAAYAISLQEKTAVTGAYVAMSVFRPEWIPPIERASNRLFFIDHSAEDKVCPFEMAEAAQKQLTQAGGIVKLSTYDGGHGWHGDVYGRIREGMSWLAEQTAAKLMTKPAE